MRRLPRERKRHPDGERGLQDKILYGDDLPWFNPHYGIGCVLFSRISDAARHAILHENAERIFERWL